MSKNNELFIDKTPTYVPKVSIVIPVYNVCGYLHQCIDSVIKQTYRNLQIIIIDDGSTDGSGHICDEYAQKDSRISVFHTENRGLAAARNLGLDNANGEFLAFIDSDDWFELYAIETLIKTIIRENVDVVVFKNTTEYKGLTIHSAPDSVHMRIFQHQDILFAYANGLFRNVSWNKLYKTTCFTNIRFPEGHNYEDGFVTWRQMKRLSKEGAMVAKLDEELIHIRMRDGSISHTMSMNNIADYWAAYLERYKSIPEYQDRLIILCFSAIGRMWQNYWWFSVDEKRDAKPIIQEMQSFSRSNFLKIIRGNYSRHTKLICLCSQSNTHLILWMCSFGGMIQGAFRRRKYKLFN